VKVVAGELTGMEGRVVRIDEEGMVHVKARDLEGVTEALEIEPRDLVKHFNVRALCLDTSPCITGLNSKDVQSATRHGCSLQVVARAALEVSLATV
jgi:hypothetical protein